MLKSAQRGLARVDRRSMFLDSNAMDACADLQRVVPQGATAADCVAGRVMLAASFALMAILWESR
jgi:hypothetical protein